MRSIPRPFAPRRTLAILAALLALAACERDVTQTAASGAGPSLVRARSEAGALPDGYRAMNERGDIVGNAGGQPYRWLRDGVQQPLPYTGFGAWVGDINDNGVAVGGVVVDTVGVDRSQPAIWDAAGQVQVLPMPPRTVSASVIAINNAGMLAGTRGDSAGEDGYFRWTPQDGYQLASYPGDQMYYGPGAYQQSWIAGFNAAGDVLLGWLEECYDQGPGPVVDCPNGEGSQSGAVRWQIAGWVDLGTSTWHLEPMDLNDHGVVVGCAENQPVRWEADGTRVSLSSLGGCAYAISNSGIVAGYLSGSGGSGGRAFRWTEAGGLQELGTLGGASSAASDVNEAGDVVGWSLTASGARHGFLWSAEGGMQSLAPLPGATWAEALGVNDAREVAGVSGTGTPGSSAGRPTRWFNVVPAHPPFANAGGPYPTRISGRRYAYSAAASTEAPGDPARYAWDMNADGQFETRTAAQQFNYAYAAPGTYTIRLVMTDAGEADTATTIVTVVRNVAPVAAIAGVPSSAGEGVLVTGTANVTDGNQSADSTEISLMRYRWEWGDGAVSGGRTATHRYADQGSYTLRLIVTDAGGLADTVVRTLPVGNVAPTARLTAPASLREGSPFTLTASALSDVPADVAKGLEVSFSCGGGYGAWGTALSIVCPARPDEGSVTVGLRVRDRDGGGSGTTRTITVGNVAPAVTAEATSATTVARGGTVSLRGAFTDPGAGDAPWRYRIYWGDGAYTLLTPVAAGATITGSHAYATPGTYSAYIGVVDGDGASGRSASIPVTVTP